MIGVTTGNGAELHDFAIRILRDESADDKLRFAAFEWLSDRWAGRAPMVVEHEVKVKPVIDVSRLSSNQLKELQSILRIANPRGKLPALPPIDIEAEPAESVVGQWPGDESDEETLKGLEEVS